MRVSSFVGVAVVGAGVFLGGAGVQADEFAPAPPLTIDARSSGMSALGLGVDDISVGAEPNAMANDTSSHKIYVANTGDSTVSVIDATTNTVTAVVPVGVHPVSIAIDEQLQRIYVANAGDSSVSVVDGRDSTVIATLNTVGAPSSVAVDQTSHKTYVTDKQNRAVRIFGVDGSMRTFQMTEEPSFVAIDSDSARAYIATGFELIVLDTLTDMRVGTVKEIRTTSIVIDETTHRVYAAQGYAVTVIDGPSLTVTNSVHITWPSQNLAIDESTQKIYATNNHDGWISVIDGATATLSQEINVARSASGAIVVDDAEGRLYVSNRTESSVSFMGVSGGSVVDRVATNSDIEALAVDETSGDAFVIRRPDFNHSVGVVGLDGTRATIATIGKELARLAINQMTRKVYVTTADGWLVVIDSATRTVDRAIPVGGSPRDLAVDERNHKIYVTDLDHDLVTVVDSSSNSIETTVSSPRPGRIVVDEEAQKVYVTNGAQNSVEVIDSISHTVVTHIDTGDIAVTDLALDRKNQRIFARPDLGKALVIDVATDSIVATMPSWGGEQPAIIDQVGGVIYMVYRTYRSSVLVACDTTTYQPVATNYLFPSPVHDNLLTVGMDQRSGLIYSANRDGSMTILTSYR